MNQKVVNRILAQISHRRFKSNNLQRVLLRVNTKKFLKKLRPQSHNRTDKFEVH